MTGCSGIRKPDFDGPNLWIPQAIPPGLFSSDSTVTGIGFTNTLTQEQILSNQHLLDGSGVATGDIDNDGFIDIYFCGLNGSNKLYRNLGNWKFEDITDSAGVAHRGHFSKGAVFADIDGDRDLDLFVTVMDGPNACFINDGTGSFAEETEKVGLVSLEDRTGNTSMTLGDIDGDGDLDMYMVSYRYKSRRDRESPVMDASGLMLYEPDAGERDILYINDGKGHLKPVALESSRFIREDNVPDIIPRAWGLSAQMQDMDNDGDPDIYVCNDFSSPDFIWINDGHGNFQAVERTAIRTTSSSSMTVDFTDINRDGLADFFVADMLSRDHKKRKMQMGEMARTSISVGKIYNRPQVMRNTLFLSRGDGTYAEIANYSGLYASDWTWSAIFIDADLDGYEDLMVTTGHAYDVQDYDTQNKIIQQKIKTVDELRRSILIVSPLDTHNYLFRNNGDLTFTETGENWGFHTAGISHGMSMADLDNDGDLDVVINNFESPAGIYKNTAIAPRIAVRLRGSGANTQGIGSKVTLLGEEILQSKEVKSGGHYLSGSDPLIVFAATSNATERRIEVIWRSGKRSLIRNVSINCIYEIDETTAESASELKSDDINPYFTDVSEKLQHEHYDLAFNDFYRQPLLPNQLSQLGPGLTWFDIDHDGDDDLLISSGKAGKATIFRNDGVKGFIKVIDKLLNKETERDQTAVLAWSDKPNSTSLVIGQSNYEESAMIPVAKTYRIEKDRFVHSEDLPSNLSATGPLTLADYDNDGDLDLFVGGRVIPGKYPDPASSELLKNEDGKFVTDEINSGKLRRIGLVSGAVFSDLDHDGDPELILALEWGPVMIFENQNGHFTDATEKYGMSKYRGWWNGLTTADLNEDGRMDIVATNWGLNSKYHYTPDHPLKIYYDDFDNNGTLDIVEAHFDPFIRSIVPERGFSCMSRAMPFIKSKVKSFEQYGAAELRSIIGPDLYLADSLSANTLAHTVFLNKGASFEAIEFPAEAQFSPAFYCGVSDFDGDGHDDVFISQNFFATQPETPRIDAGRGLWLRGDGSGKLQAVPGQESGIRIYGEQRGAALSDYNKDGRIDLAVSQNGARTKLYKNVQAKPGLRVRLKGDDKNLSAVGAIAQLIYSDHSGPARQIHTGSGYWSQDSHVQVFGIAEYPQKIKIIWPGGKSTTSDIPHNAREITVE